MKLKKPKFTKLKQLFDELKTIAKWQDSIMDDKLDSMKRLASAMAELEKEKRDGLAKG